MFRELYVQYANYVNFIFLLNISLRSKFQGILIVEIFEIKLVLYYGKVQINKMIALL